MCWLSVIWLMFCYSYKAECPSPLLVGGGEKDILISHNLNSKIFYLKISRRARIHISAIASRAYSLVGWTPSGQNFVGSDRLFK